MFVAFLYLLVGSAISYFSQLTLHEIAAKVTTRPALQTMIKIFLDAVLSVTWLVSIPLYLMYRVVIKQRR